MLPSSVLPRALLQVVTRVCYMKGSGSSGVVPHLPHLPCPSPPSNHSWQTHCLSSAQLNDSHLPVCLPYHTTFVTSFPFFRSIRCLPNNRRERTIATILKEDPSSYLANIILHVEFGVPAPKTAQNTSGNGSSPTSTHPPAGRRSKAHGRGGGSAAPPPVHAQQVERYELHPLRICTYFLFLNCYILSLLCTAAGALAWVSQRGLLFTFLLRVFPACWLIRVFHSVRTLTLSLSLPLSLSLNHFYVRHRIRIIW